VLLCGCAAVRLCGCVAGLRGCVAAWLWIRVIGSRAERGSERSEESDMGCVTVLVVWLCGCVVVWLCGCVAVWLCGCFFVAAWLWIRVFGSRAERGASGARKAISAVCDCVVCGGAAVWLCAV
jgi:hypothetical protein